MANLIKMTGTSSKKKKKVKSPSIRQLSKREGFNDTMTVCPDEVGMDREVEEGQGAVWDLVAPAVGVEGPRQGIGHRNGRERINS